jgi:hypothetical protein
MNTIIKYVKDKWQCLLIKIVIILIIGIAIYKLSSSNNFEKFTDNTEIDNKDYLKFNETYIENNDSKSDVKKLELLYSNYSGDEVGADKWENKTLSQCIDTCNKLDNCAGFSRDLVQDNENATCYPHTEISKCYSNRKGDFTQRQHALGYNTYIKANTKGALTQCLGDANLTLKRPIYIKSYAYPTMFVGINTDNDLSLVDQNDKNIDVINSCKFKVVAGLEGSGTVSLQHVITGKYV